MIAKLAHDLSQRRHNLRRKRVKKPIKRFSKTAIVAAADSAPISAQDSAARHRHLRQLWKSRNNPALSHQQFAERNCSSCQECLRPTEDQLHSTDDPIRIRQAAVLEAIRRLIHRQRKEA